VVNKNIPGTDRWVATDDPYTAAAAAAAAAG